MTESLGDRMKGNYENRARYKLIRRIPVIMRLDGRAFHTLTRGCDKPFDANLSTCLSIATRDLLEEAQGSKFAYIQSDEISILFTDYDELTTQAWFDYNIQKLTSISSAILSTSFTRNWGFTGIFDCRVFNIPNEEVANYFVWRQKDWIRNSVQMLAQANFSHKELQNKGQSDMHDMLQGKGINWADLAPQWKNGVSLKRNDLSHWVYEPAPIFTQNRDAIEQYLSYSLL